MKSHILVTLAGQPNSGKSTLFNMLTGARQHVANYPGVTVEKKTGYFGLGDGKAELVDLPGTYSLTSYSLEEKVARDFILQAHPDVTINVADAANLKRNLYLTLQLLEMEAPLVLALNMMDVAERRSIAVDTEALSGILGIPVVPTVGKKREGVAPLRVAIENAARRKVRPTFRLDYQKLEPGLERLRERLAKEDALAAVPLRWLSVKLLENDEAAAELLRSATESAPEIMSAVAGLREEFFQETGVAAERHIAFTRHREAVAIAGECVVLPEGKRSTFSDRIDRVVCHKVCGPIILVAILFLLYQVAIVYGNELAGKVWPLWDKGQVFLAGFLPEQGFLEDPTLRSLGVWSMKSMTAVLNYLPIFLLLFALIAILEDSGYMPRMAFILDRAFRRFGLHGQSTLPLILGGVYVGGCAIPAVMATRAIPDEKARLATILIAPIMNCLAKVPLYLILISAFYSEQGGLAMFFIATVTLFMALPVSKALSLTLLKGKPSAPFIMEMPPYHLPTIRGIVSRSVERTWLFVKKIFSVVLAVAVIVFVLISFPGPGKGSMAKYESGAEKAREAFMAAIAKTSFAERFSRGDIMPMLQLEEDLKNAKRGVTDQDVAKGIDAQFKVKNPVLYAIVRGVGDDGKAMRAPLRKLNGERKRLRREIREETFLGSFLGMAGKALEPLTKYAGFNWKINIALLSAFAAKENSAATLGAIYGIDDEAEAVRERIKSGEIGFGPLHALALMLFMALYPPCVPTSVMVRLQTASTKWMLFSIAYQIALGLGVSVLVFTGGSFMGLTGWQAMWSFYALCIIATVVMGMIPERKSESVPATGKSDS